MESPTLNATEAAVAQISTAILVAARPDPAIAQAIRRDVLVIVRQTIGKIEADSQAMVRAAIVAFFFAGLFVGLLGAVALVMVARWV